VDALASDLSLIFQGYREQPDGAWSHPEGHCEPPFRRVCGRAEVLDRQYAVLLNVGLTRPGAAPGMTADVVQGLPSPSHPSDSPGRSAGYQREVWDIADDDGARGDQRPGTDDHRRDTYGTGTDRGAVIDRDSYRLPFRRPSAAPSGVTARGYRSFVKTGPDRRTHPGPGWPARRRGRSSAACSCPPSEHRLRRRHLDRRCTADRVSLVRESGRGARPGCHPQLGVWCHVGTRLDKNSHVSQPREERHAGVSPPAQPRARPRRRPVRRVGPERDRSRGDA
jgi:hypothetical protein